MFDYYFVLSECIPNPSPQETLSSVPHLTTFPREINPSFVKTVENLKSITVQDVYKEKNQKFFSRQFELVFMVSTLFVDSDSKVYYFRVKR